MWRMEHGYNPVMVPLSYKGHNVDEEVEMVLKIIKIIIITIM